MPSPVTAPPQAPAFATVPGHDYAPDRYARDRDAYDPAPRDPAPRTFLPDPDDLPEPALQPSRRADGWSAAAQRRFLERLAEGHGVDAACRCVGLSTASAYAFRRTAKGAAFALGWRAASLVARDAIAETLLVRALEGTVETVVRGEIVVTRHRFDNRLALSLLARLDRQVEAAPDADVKAARLVAQEFDAYLGLLERDEGPARAGLFLAQRTPGLAANDDAAPDLAPIYALAAADRYARTGVATAAEVPIADLDPAHRAGWTAEQWARAEAAGLVAIAPPLPAETAPAPQLPQHSALQEPVWWDEAVGDWRTRFPPPPGFLGEECGEPGDDDYERALDDDERAPLDRIDDATRAAVTAREGAERDAWFAALAAEHGVPRPVDPAHQPSERTP